MSKRRPVTVDVREDIQRGKEPFSRIMAAVAGLGPKDDLLLIAPFEPTPLYAVLAPRGFSHAARETESGDWEILFTRAAAGQEASTSPDTALCQAPSAEL